MRQIEQLKDHGLVFAEQIAIGDAEQQRVADLTCGAGDGNNQDDGSTPGVTKDSILLANGDDAGYAGSPGLNHQMTDAMNAFVAKRKPDFTGK